VAEDTNVTSAHPISKKVILCVDDDEAILQYEKTLLELSGYAVLTASSGKQALQLVTTSELDVVILDYGMPEMSGHEIALEIRLARPRLPIILLSGSDVPTDVLALVDAFILKIEASRKLVPTIADLCSRIPISSAVA
jgi:CheY-like chemotaxis protein